jgi:hypothetical protein
MAANSRRELLLAKIKTTLDSVSSLSYVERKPLKGLSDLNAYPTTQMPLAIVLGSMPVSEEKFSEREIKLDRVRSILKATIIVYAMDNQTPDSTVSTLADDIWAAIYNDITLGFSWVSGLTIIPDANVAVYDPYVAFSIDVDISYFHGKGGI